MNWMKHGEREIGERKYLCDEFIINGFQVSVYIRRKKRSDNYVDGH